MDAPERIALLRERGLNVRVTHRRPVRVVMVEPEMATRAELERIRRGPGEEPWAKPAHRFEFSLFGGMTTVVIAAHESVPAAEGVARCSKHDHFNRGRGLEVALGRAEAELATLEALEMVAMPSVAADIPF